MHADDSITSRRRKDRPTLLVLCVLLSLLLHLCVVFLLPYEELRSEQPLTEKQQPTIVRLVDKPKPEPKTNLEYELDQKPLEPAPQPPQESTRLAEQNQQVAKETAPQGDDSRDQQDQLSQSKPQSLNRQAEKSTRKQETQTTTETRVEKKSTQPTTPVQRKELTQELQEEKLPTLDQLTALPSNTVGRIVQNELSARERRKERNDIETGDTVWLNLTQGRLISFFRRFRDQIEGVWNYPREAIEKQQQGTLLLKITVDRDGELIDVELLTPSGSEILDFEAIQAVYRAAPFGPLGRHYPYPDLKIMANFSYRISGKFIYGRRR